MLIPSADVNILNTFRVMIILKLLSLLTNLHLKLLSTQGTGADKLLSTHILHIAGKYNIIVFMHHSYHITLLKKQWPGCNCIHAPFISHHTAQKTVARL